jgi:CBS domain containing-hemolysin-like protein
MTETDDVVFLSTTVSAEENLERIRENPHTRFPLIGDQPTDFQGIVYIPAVADYADELRSGDMTFEEIAAPPMTLREDTYISDDVDRFQEENQELALVLNEDENEVTGLVTATDALEAVMGEIEDPLDMEEVGT